MTILAPPQANRFSWPCPVVLGLAMLVALVAGWSAPLRLPALGLDESWKQALVHATDHGRRFGVDLVFTYGPLHQLVTQQLSERFGPLLIGRLFCSVAWFAASTLVGLQAGVKIGRAHV